MTPRDQRKLRVLMGPVEIAGYYSALEEGLLGLGVDCRFVELQRHPFAYTSARPQPALVRAAARLRHHRKRFSSIRPLKRVMKLVEHGLINIWLFSAIVHYDVFILGFGRSFVASGWDVRLMRKLRKTIIVNLGHGTEARAPYLNGKYKMVAGTDREAHYSRLRSETRRVAASVRRWESIATVVVGAPLSTSTFARRPFVSILHLGLPVRSLPPLVPPEAGDGGGRAVRVLHAPSDSLVKGTEDIRRAVSNLQSRGLNIVYEEVQGRPHGEVIAALQRCDFVIDELWSDTPLSGIGSEAAGCGKPAVVGGYGWADLAAVVSRDRWPASAICSPNEVESMIERLVLDSAYRKQLGAYARDFVEREWSATEVARRWMRLIQDEIPPEWIIDPQEISYLYGCGQSREETSRNVGCLISRFGPEALEIQDRPALLDAYASMSLASDGASDAPAD